MRLTIGIPFHNAQETLLSAIRSVFAQTYQDWELILLDDGSTDDSLQIARSISDSRVRVHVFPDNRGLSECLNEITRIAKGEYIARMDADDLMHPERLERQVDLLDRSPGVDLVGAGAYIIDEHDRPIGVRGLMPIDLSPASLLRENRILHPTITGRIQWFRENQYDCSFLRAEDHELWCRALHSTAFVHVGEPLLFYRNAAQGRVRKYLESCRSDRRIYKRYGPARAGWGETAVLMAKAWAKPAIYALLTQIALESRVLSRRYVKISDEQFQAATAVLQALTQVPVPSRPTVLSR